jgi:predicted DNA-binding transcriptional regulator AlpA
MESKAVPVVKTKGPEKEDRRLNVEDAAKYLGCCKSWLYDRMKAGTLPYPLISIRYDFGLRFNVSNLDAYIRLKEDSAGLKPERIKGGAM